jgi:hypothetical protein
VTRTDARLQSLIINFGMSPGFQLQDYKNLKFPATMLIDYVRVYQRSNEINVGCDPSDHPTTKYIQEYVTRQCSSWTWNI